MSIIPPVPSLRPLISLNILLASLGCIGLLLPIRLAITLRGVIASDGPTTVITAPNDAVVSKLPKEGQRYSDGSVLFRFQQPVFLEDLEARKLEIRDLQQRLDQSRIECRHRMQSAQERLAEAKKMDAMNTEAYTQQLISRLQLFQYRNSVNLAFRDLDEIAASCRQEQAQLRSEVLSNQTKLRREQVSQQFLGAIPAPDNGSVYAINVKPGQRVRTGETLARFVRSNQSIASLRITSSDRPFVNVGRGFDVSTPTYSYLTTQPVYHCSVDTITPDLMPTSNAALDRYNEGPDQLSYLMRCRFRQSIDKGAYPLLIGMDIVAKSAGNEVTLFQVLLKGFRATLRQTT